MSTCIYIHFSQPTEKRQAHTEGANGFAWSRSHENVLATMGRPGRQVKAFNIRHHQVCDFNYLVSVKMLKTHLF